MIEHRSLRVTHVMAILLANSLLHCSYVSAQMCSGAWSIFSWVPYQQSLFPDTNGRYFRYRYQLDPEQPALAFRIQGKYPHARYMNFNTYNQRTMDPTASMADIHIVPDLGSANPFLPGASRTARPRQYTVWAWPQGVTPPHSLGNVLPLPRMSVKELPPLQEIWYRIYVPDQGSGDMGGESLPVIEAFDAATLQPAECPKLFGQIPEAWKALAEHPPLPLPSASLAFVRPRPHALYSNEDNLYLSSYVFPGQAAVVHFRPPTSPQTYHDVLVMPSQKQVRYWTLCLSGQDTFTEACVLDEKALRHEDGTVTIVYGPQALAPQLALRNINLIPTSKFILPVMLYRHLLPAAQFEQSMRLVPLWPAQKHDPFFGHSRAMEAYHFMGDYAPTGRDCDPAQLTQDVGSHSMTLCGVTIPN